MTSIIYEFNSKATQYDPFKEHRIQAKKADNIVDF
jgi:hypothetical protein